MHNLMCRVEYHRALCLPLSSYLNVSMCVCVCAAETTAESTASCWVQEIAALHVNVHEANSRASGAETSLADAQAKEQDLVEKLACKHANQEKLQAQVCSLASQLNAALAASHQVGFCCTTLHFACFLSVPVHVISSQ